MDSLETRLKVHARALGFEPVGIARATEADTFAHFTDWLDRGFEGEMAYMSRHAVARQHPKSILPDVRSVVMAGMNYFTPDEPSNRQSAGKVARYARGADYHDVLRERLGHLLRWIKQEVPGCEGRGVVDTAPLLERDFARRAGLGWFGKNTMLINKREGSYFILGALLLTIDLVHDAVHETSHCGNCRACLDACPTGAFPEPGVLDSRKCISYLTIELRGPIPKELREPIGNWVFGCDVCQEVCPWNRKATTTDEPAFAPLPAVEGLDPVELLSLSEYEFRKRFRGTALWRTKRRGLLRNAAIVLGNRGDEASLPALRRALDDSDAIVREAAAWAIGTIEAKTRTMKVTAPPLQS
jgi:epoxyqueuosine reductase